ncbi:MAG: hypothetical protein WBG42_06190 [Cryomorphaceae bacterium]
MSIENPRIAINDSGEQRTAQTMNYLWFLTDILKVLAIRSDESIKDELELLNHEHD